MRVPELNSETVYRTYMWRAVMSDGLERGEWLQAGHCWIMRGTILRLSDSGPTEVRYEITTDDKWLTRTANISCETDRGKKDLRITRDNESWYANGKRLQLPKGCMDVDLAWSPCTNTLPIRRLNLSIGSNSGLLIAAWVRLPELTVESLPQSYERTGPQTYIYTSRGGFRAALSLDEDDLVVDYEGVWKRIGENKNGG